MGCMRMLGPTLLGLLVWAGAAPPLWADGPRVALVSDAEAWRRLPAAMEGSGQPLPTWARALAAALPRTTAAMLELDFLQRAKNPLEPKLRGMMRWTAAHANHCAYSEAQAIADLRRAGMDEGSIPALGKDDSKL